MATESPRHDEERAEEAPAVARKIEQLDALLQDVADDAEGRAESYPAETLVPEGGE